MRRYNGLVAAPERSLTHVDILGGHGVFSTAVTWQADNSNSRYRDAALFWLNNIERSMSFVDQSAFFGSCREDSGFCGTYTGSHLLWSGFHMAEYAMAYSVMRDLMSEGERKALADKIFNGIWDEPCNNRLVLGGGTVESVKGSTQIKGTGTEFTKLPNPAGRWIQLKDGFKPYESWYRVVSVQSDTELTIHKPANVSISSSLWFFENDWTAGTCGAIWRIAHHTTMSNVINRIGATTLRAAVNPDDTTIQVVNPWAFAQAVPFHVYVGTEWMKVTGREGDRLTVERGEFFTNKSAQRAGTFVMSNDQPVSGGRENFNKRNSPEFPDFDTVLDNKNHVYMYSLIFIGLAFADDDPRARALLETTWNYWHDFAAWDQMALGTGITRGGFSYFPFWTAYSHELAALGRNSFQPPIDLSEGNWLRKAQLYPIYHSLPWSPRDTVPFADSGSSTGTPLRHFKYFPLGYDLFPDTGETRYAANFFRTAQNYWTAAQMGSAGLGFDTSARWLIYTPPGVNCPSADCIDYKTLPTHHFFTETDNNGRVTPANGYHAVVSKQDWTEAATIVWMQAFGNPGDHLGAYATPGSYRIGKAGKWLHATGSNTLDSSNPTRGSYVEVEGPTAIALPVSSRRNTLGTFGPVVDVDQKLGGKSTVYWRVNATHAFQPTAAVKHHHRYFAHFKGSTDYLVVYDSVETSSEKQKLRRIFCYTGDGPAANADNVYQRSGAEVACKKPESNLLTRVLLPADPAKITDGNDGNFSRIAIVNDGRTTGSEFLVVHQTSAGASSPMPETVTVSSQDALSAVCWCGMDLRNSRCLPGAAVWQARPRLKPLSREPARWWSED